MFGSVFLLDVVKSVSLMADSHLHTKPKSGPTCRLCSGTLKANKKLCKGGLCYSKMYSATLTKD